VIGRSLPVSDGRGLWTEDQRDKAIAQKQGRRIGGHQIQRGVDVQRPSLSARAETDGAVGDPHSGVPRRRPCCCSQSLEPPPGNAEIKPDHRLDVEALLKAGRRLLDGCQQLLLPTDGVCAQGGLAYVDRQSKLGRHQCPCSATGRIDNPNPHLPVPGVVQVGGYLVDRQATHRQAGHGHPRCKTPSDSAKEP
jgi:hypothetical protein